MGPKGVPNKPHWTVYGFHRTTNAQGVDYNQQWYAHINQDGSADLGPNKKTHKITEADLVKTVSISFNIPF